ncbi:hypothetical protein [Priestia sp. P5]|uniref:hypothetical protein n=1 Tax=Priestia sp. P5 TaxID=2917806 RepID=UPI0024060226|nr:hypothetical protein [Priestia sp. P5]MDG0058286.1 hypothetical protein [Priestia sp. P5]
MRLEGMILLAVAILLILLGIYLWTKGDSREPFWEALSKVMGNILVWNLPVFTTFRAWSVFLWLIGIGIFMIFMWAKISNWF